MFTDPIEEVCLTGHIPLRQFMRLAVLNSPHSFTNVEEICNVHLETYKSKGGGFKALPDYIRHYTESTAAALRAANCPAHA